MKEFFETNNHELIAEEFHYFFSQVLTKKISK